MTIFEMLEKLETEIVSLQTRYQDLANSVQHTPANGNGSAAGKQKRPRKPVRKKVAKSAAKKQASDKLVSSPEAQQVAQLELPVDEPGVAPDSQPGRVLGKRQALGKSLVQLRKMSAWRNVRSTEE